MRIHWVTHQFFPDQVGGTEVYTLGLAKRWQESGNEARVITFRETSETDPGFFGIEEYEYDGIPVIALTYNLAASPLRLRAEFDNPEVAGWISPIWKDCTPDVVHFVHLMKFSSSLLKCAQDRGINTVVTLPDYWSICPRHTLLTHREKRCDGPRTPADCAPCIQDTHGYFPEKIFNGPAWLYTPYLKAATHQPTPWFQEKKRRSQALYQRNQTIRDRVHRANRVFVLSPFQKARLVQNGFESARLELRPHGLETESLKVNQPPQRWPEKIKLAYIGSITRFKGVQLLLDAWENADTSRMELSIYGAFKPEDDWAQQLMRRIDALPNVFAQGLFAASDTGKILSQVDALVVPSLWYENEPLVVKMALYSNIPVMASDVGSLRDMITPGETGWLVQPNASAWTQALTNLHDQTPPPFQNGTYRIISMDDYALEMFNTYRNELE